MLCVLTQTLDTMWHWHPPFWPWSLTDRFDLSSEPFWSDNCCRLNKNRPCLVICQCIHSNPSLLVLRFAELILPQTILSGLQYYIKAVHVTTSPFKQIMSRIVHNSQWNAACCESNLGIHSTVRTHFQNTISIKFVWHKLGKSIILRG